MGKIYEALMKAEAERQARRKLTPAFEPEPLLKPQMKAEAGSQARRELPPAFEPEPPLKPQMKAEAESQAWRELPPAFEPEPPLKPQMKAEAESQARRELPPAFEPEPPLKPQRRITYEVPFEILEEFHRIKRNILLANPEEKIKTLLFSSPAGGEGSSTVLVNFGITLASDGQRVLLVDANLRKPFLHRIFDLEKENGLTELILGNGNLTRAIKETGVRDLCVITSGKAHSNPSSLFESRFLDFYIQEMKAQADWVIFDSPPINTSNEAVFLATKVDGVVMVVEAEKTRWHVAESAKQKIESRNGRILGVVLNNRKFYIPGWLYQTL